MTPINLIEIQIEDDQIIMQNTVRVSEKGTLYPYRPVSGLGDAYSLCGGEIMAGSSELGKCSV